MILDDGIYDFHAAIINSLPPFLAEWIDESRDDAANAVMSLLMTIEHPAPLGNAEWVVGHGRGHIADVARAFRAYTLADMADRIVAPALVLDPDNDQFLKGEPQRAAEAIVNAKTTLVTLNEAEGAGEHCHMGAMSRLHQIIFDWLDETLSRD